MEIGGGGSSKSKGQVDMGQGGVDTGALGLVGEGAGRGAAPEGTLAAARGCGEVLTLSRGL